MSFRRRLALVSAAAVAVVVVLGSFVAYGLVRTTLRGQIDDSLRARAAVVANAGPARVLVRPPLDGPLAGPPVAVQLVDPEGIVLRAGPEVERALPVTGAERAVAAGEREPFFEDREVGGVHVRVHTTAVGPMRAIQVFRPLTEVDDVLGRLRLGLALIALAGIAAAAVLGRVAARAAVRPVSELTEAAEHVSATRDLSRRIAMRGGDELARLAGAFNAMLEALDRSQRAQRRLVADASHELRTPLTALRTNLEVLDDAGHLDAPDQESLRRDVVGQLEELTLLVGDLVDLARDDEPAELEHEEVRLDALVAEALARARRNAPAVRFEARLEPCLVRGVPGRLDRAVANLLDNAAKFGGETGPVEVELGADGRLSVRDHGPGIARDDLPHVFDRFYRAPAARGRPGSGLGLAIVRQVADAHDGRVAAEPATGGGALLRLELPALPAPSEPLLADS